MRTGCHSLFRKKSQQTAHMSVYDQQLITRIHNAHNLTTRTNNVDSI